ncbi:transposase, putative, N-terminal domain-containing protein [Sulfobacillus thermosulfidooxidans DSM 9293]|uniref:Transposase, putative, N-terminal domain-containing protein n=2 Tax=Sulfobacillus thermosulfidooxidans TaxID=28034 RepID=A0A1W1WK31_SULTA|nr:transposase, putative, N-terminal domain-containing protein [Sulfobacillus thermosulfidooxidans DSM 9293]
MLTAKLKLHTTCETGQRLRDTANAYQNALNYPSHVTFENGKMSNPLKLHGLVYRELPERFALPSQLACSVSKQVGVTFKRLWTEVKQNAPHRKNGYSQKWYKNPKFTAQGCPHCDAKNRPDQALTFRCQKCTVTLGADLLGARNMTLRTLHIRQDWIGNGLFSTAPDGSDPEAKAKRLPGCWDCSGVEILGPPFGRGG